MHLIMHLIRETLKFNAPADKLLSDFFRENKKFTSTERTLVAETTYTLLRNYYKLTAVAGDNVPDLVGLVWLKLMQIKPSELSDIKLIDYPRLSKIEFGTDELSKLELPKWILDQLHMHYSNEEIEQLALSLQQTAPLDLRVNLIKSDLNTVLSELQEFNPQKMEFSHFGVRLTDKAFLAKHKLFTNGSIEVQDQSSQLAGLLLSPKRGDMVVDFCAGSGGKTLLFGMMMRNSGRIYAFDVNEKRLNNLTPRLARSGLSNVFPQLINNEADNKIKRLHNKIDSVFVDAPCSGIGTLRRNPELKFRQTEAGITELNEKQSSILAEASKLVKVGGHLVYATCSILHKENQDIINQFLSNHPEFKLVPAAEILDNPKLARADGCLVLLPNIHQTDGFFAARLQKVTE